MFRVVCVAVRQESMVGACFWGLILWRGCLPSPAINHCHTTRTDSQVGPGHTSSTSICSGKFSITEVTNPGSITQRTGMYVRTDVVSCRVSPQPANHCILSLSERMCVCASLALRLCILVFRGMMGCVSVSRFGVLEHGWTFLSVLSLYYVGAEVLDSKRDPAFHGKTHRVRECRGSWRSQDMLGYLVILILWCGICEESVGRATCPRHPKYQYHSMAQDQFQRRCDQDGLAVERLDRKHCDPMVPSPISSSVPEHEHTRVRKLR